MEFTLPKISCGFVIGMLEEANTDYDIPLRCQPLLHFNDLFIKASDATEGDDFIISLHARP